MKVRTTLLGAALALLSGCTSGDDGDPTPSSTSLCDAQQISDALSKALPGETVQVGACTVTGSFTVPAGVTLSGVTRDKSILVAANEMPAVVLTPGTTAPRLTTLTVVSDVGSAGVLAEGAGDAQIDAVDVRATRGIGVGVEGVTSFTFHDATLTGPVTEGNAAMLPADATPEQTATHGLVLVRVAKADLTNVSSSSFAGYGALFIESTTTWTTGSASSNLGVGLMVIDGQADLSRVDVCHTLRGGRSLPSYGAAFVSRETVTQDPEDASEGASVTVRDLRVCSNENIGLLYADGQSFHLSGGSIDDNGSVGLLLEDSSNLYVDNLTITNTRADAVPLGEQDAEITLGDGIYLARSAENISFDRVISSDNERIQVQVDLGSNPLETGGLSWKGVQVDAVDEELGALCQGTLSGSAEVWGPEQKVAGVAWDVGILRNDVALTNDNAITLAIDLIGVVGPCNLPSPVSVVKLGLDALLRF